MTQDNATSFGETVNVAPLVTCFGAVAEMSRLATTKDKEIQCDNRARLAGAVRRSGCDLHDVAPELQSGILLLKVPATRRIDRVTATMANHFGERAIAVTFYPGGWLRLSAPRQVRVSLKNATRLELALRTLSETDSKSHHSISTPLVDRPEGSLPEP